MSLSWHKRKTRLNRLLKSTGDENEDGMALDRILHGQRVIGKTSRTTEIESLRFNDDDLKVLGTLEYGQFGVIDVVNCHLDRRVYVRKSTEKQFALRTRDQCSPQSERDILLRATETNAKWAPHLLCAFQTDTHVNLVMNYAEGGTLWDVFESSPLEGRLSERDLRWWSPQIVSAIHWCHSQGFVHRDIKPHNFVLTQTSHLLLIDFGSSAPLLPPQHDGSQRVPRRHCLVPCGTCDYISPEILQAHEEALLDLEMSNEGQMPENENAEGYGRETDWWSLGSMLYEMAYGVAPFFANDIAQTYLKIVNHETSLRFNKSIILSDDYHHFLRRLLTNCERRLGRRDVGEIASHPFFRGVDWENLHSQSAPTSLHLPQFNYAMSISSTDRHPIAEQVSADAASEPFGFSAFFHSSTDSLSPPPGPSFAHSTPSRSTRRPSPQADSTSPFIGFSWGPLLDAFPHTEEEPPLTTLQTPRPLRIPSAHTPGTASTPIHAHPGYSTPRRPHGLTPAVPPTGTARRTTQRRSVTDREAMKQLTECVGMSAREKVLASGRKPKVLQLQQSRSGSLVWQNELKFLTSQGPSDDERGGGIAGDLPDWTAKDGDGVVLSSDTESEGPPSPSPSPRPGSAASMSSKRSKTPPTIAFSRQSGSWQLDHVGPNHVPAKKGRASLPHDQRTSLNQVSAPPNKPTVPATLEGKHNALMQDIEDIERRLGTLVKHVTGQG